MVQPRRLKAEPLNIDGPRRAARVFPKVPITPGLEVTHRASGTSGTIIETAHGGVKLRDRQGRDHLFRLGEGAFAINREPCTLVLERPPAPNEVALTASGSISVANAPAKIAKASRIFVEGIHDAELLERVWGDDLRIEGIVVERLDGADNLSEIVRKFGPRPGRRLGILLDHLVSGTKEQRMAAEIDHPDVLITGHPYIDIWEAVKPKVVGIEAWPSVPRGEDWKTGITTRLGVDDPPAFWRHILASINSYRDLEAPLVGAVEALIDFVTEPQP